MTGSSDFSKQDCSMSNYMKIISTIVEYYTGNQKNRKVMNERKAESTESEKQCERQEC